MLAGLLGLFSILVGSTSAQICTGPELFARTAAVTAACCDDDDHPCTGGLPTTCTATCAAVLLPMQHDCADMATMMGMADVIDTAAADCVQAAPCTTGPEFFAYTQTMTATCCEDSSAACASGFPTATCSTDCAAVLLPMQAVCGSLMTMMGMDASYTTAAAACANSVEAAPLAPDPCSSEPCQNGGACSVLGAGSGHRILQSEGFVCACADGFRGTTCDSAPDPCEYPTRIVCGTSGSCDGGSCSCSAGFTGTRCEVPPDLCQ